MIERRWLLLPLSLCSSLAWASDVEFSAKLHKEYLEGEQIHIALEAANPGDEVQTIPNLSARPWLVQFTMASKNGNTVTLSTTKPDHDSGDQWTLPARSRRVTNLEVPSGGALTTGDYTLNIQVQLEEEVVNLPPHELSLQRAQPVGGDLDPSASPVARDALYAVWTHKSLEGYDLYLHKADAEQPNKVLANRYLLSWEDPIEPLITASRGTDELDRHIVWPSGDRRITYLRLEGLAVQGQPRTIEIPWPNGEVLGRGATGPDGMLHVPLWIPAPKGTGGHIRILTVDERGTPRFRKATHAQARPAALQTTVDAGGSAHFLVLQTDSVTLYTVRPSASPELPVPGRKVWSAAKASTAEAARFGALPTTSDYPGGLAVLLVTQSTAGWQSHWIGLQGNPITTSAVTRKTGELIDLIVSGSQPVLYVTRDSDGFWIREDEAKTALPSIGSTWSVNRKPSGEPVLRQLQADGPITTQVLPLPTEGEVAR